MEENKRIKKDTSWVDCNKWISFYDDNGKWLYSINKSKYEEERKAYNDLMLEIERELIYGKRS